jgi:hypothetical protein
MQESEKSIFKRSRVLLYIINFNNKEKNMKWVLIYFHPLVEFGVCLKSKDCLDIYRQMVIALD